MDRLGVLLVAPGMVNAGFPAERVRAGSFSMKAETPRGRQP